MRNVPRSEVAREHAVDIPVELGELAREAVLVVAEHPPHRPVEAGLDQVPDAGLLVVETFAARLEVAAPSRFRLGLSGKHGTFRFTTLTEAEHTLQRVANMMVERERSELQQAEIQEERDACKRRGDPTESWPELPPPRGLSVVTRKGHHQRDQRLHHIAALPG
jgi:hypothetical protein